MKRCSKCGKTKKDDQFDLRWTDRPILRSHCKVCRKKYQKNRAKLDNKLSRARRYNLSIEQLEKLLKDGKCDICGREPKEGSRGLFVDHNHITGKVRGVLCVNCNSALGMFQGDDGTEILYSAIQYLENNIPLAKPDKERRNGSDGH